MMRVARRIRELLALIPVLYLCLVRLTMAQDASCATYGLTAAPDTPVLMKDPSDATSAVVVGTNCVAMKKTSITVTDDGDRSLRLSSLGIGKLLSYPPVEYLYLDDNKIEGFDFHNDTKLFHIQLKNNRLSSLESFQFPPRLAELDLQANTISNVESDILPDALKTLILSENNLTSLDNIELPTSLQELDLSKNKFRTLRTVEFPAMLTKLILSGNPLTGTEKAVLPSTLQTVNLQNCGLEFVRGLKFPSQLEHLLLDGNDIKLIEIRDSDVSVLKNLLYNLPAIDDIECEQGTKMVVKETTAVCVLSDDAFEELYGATSRSSAKADDTDATSSNVKPASMGSGDGNQSILLIALIVGCVILVGVIVFGIRTFWRKGRGNANDYASSNSLRMLSNPDSRSYKDTPNNFIVCTSSGPSLEMITPAGGDRSIDDVHYDEELVKLRIPSQHIEKKRVLARGGFGLVFLAKYNGKHVAVKQLQRDQLRQPIFDNFLMEIRLCATLNHPRIVQFLGVSWNTMQDLAVILEYMPRGDLFSFLRQTRKSSEGRTKDNKKKGVELVWFPMSDSKRGVTVSKAKLAAQVAEALIFLHGQETPVLHRDIKSKNVLLTEDYEIKVTDFGISRMQTLEETMTREVGTVSWIAPEVIKGGRYTEKADIYSFGVLLTELDTCYPPYTVGFGPNASKRTNTWIASMVSAGALQPALSSDCPMRIRELALKCMSFVPECRPSAVEINSQLKLMMKRSNSGEDLE
ncbi:hypothetical protein Poli38472_013840 [Pythium oligandrum]|uniref:Protein kinase domain-containing protein n=1 Tax=Pythium oligandrum TaxID=41045 RepID=A0A8K1FDP4_PYTOL|nr:hypothetical protein Poli38472_013840 [Pythium oligandrum]|eukprot:TMW55078.1 hypothetical protein Poli38472_013840 [Pythium oligandrum]